MVNVKKILASWVLSLLSLGAHAEVNSQSASPVPERLPPAIADQGHGSVKVMMGLLDSEFVRLWAAPHALEATVFATLADDWQASSQLLLSSQPTSLEPSSLTTHLKEASLSGPVAGGILSVGRVLPRLQVLTINESAQTFLHQEPSLDGVAWTTPSEKLRWGIFAGGPWVLGVVAGRDFGITQFSFLYRGERNQVTRFRVLLPDGKMTDASRAAHSHLFELGLHLTGETFLLESLLQGVQQGAQRKVSAADAWGGLYVGEIDPQLPRTSVDYRVATQAKVLFSKKEERTRWLFVSLASKAASHFSGQAEPSAAVPLGGGNRTQLAGGIETGSPALQAQLGMTAEFASSPQFAFLAQRRGGELEKFKTKATLWVSTRIKF